jgi:hypothetical protein
LIQRCCIFLKIRDTTKSVNLSDLHALLDFGVWYFLSILKALRDEDTGVDAQVGASQRPPALVNAGGEWEGILCERRVV